MFHRRVRGEFASNEQFSANLLKSFRYDCADSVIRSRAWINGSALYPFQFPRYSGCMTDTIYVLNGPNLNLLGMREPEIYGSDTLDDIAGMLEDRARELGVEVDVRQTNHEGHLVDWLHEAQAEGAMAVLLNAGAYTHTSIALLDAIRAIRTPVIEVHLSDPKTREPFRHLSYVGMAAVQTVEGLGARSYIVALDAAANL